MVKNPYDNTRLSRYILDPEVVDVIGFCTKNPEHMLPDMGKLERYGQFWYVTLTCYEKDIEPNVLDKEEVIRSFRELSKIVGKERVGWRYDPILINEKYTVERHLEEFKYIAHKLKGYTDICVISFIDIYGKVSKNYPEARAVSMENRELLGKAMTHTAKECGMIMRPCHEGRFLERFGADCSGCMTKELYEQAAGAKLDIPKVKPSREGCRCYLSCDIGEYDTCGHMCKYCYANNDLTAVRENLKNHHPDSPVLIGYPDKNAIIHDVPQKSWKDLQMNLFG